MSESIFDPLRALGYDLVTRSHAAAILNGDFPDEAAALVEALAGLRLSARDVIRSGGGQAESTMRLRDALYRLGWQKHTFVTRITVDGREREATSHEIDHVRRAPAGTLALEIEWNNKDPFFDRDLENFQRLHAMGAISVGVLITRGETLQAALPAIVAGAIREAGIRDPAELEDWGVKERTSRQMTNLRRGLEAGLEFPEAFARSFVADKFTASTTHWAKLAERVARGVGNPCPLLLIGLPARILVEGELPAPEAAPDLFSG